ncbi:hypothetical protein CmiCFBP2404_06360 [Clavibacter michiganensis subsp. insidiosus]|nr:hypothetical protein CmiCFBP2404_06360 [Clavibacter michiganensis subsp. insidiosus]
MRRAGPPTRASRRADRPGWDPRRRDPWRRPAAAAASRPGRCGCPCARIRRRPPRRRPRRPRPERRPP